MEKEPITINGLEKLKKELDNLGHNYFILEGKNRIENSIAKISQLITKV